MLTSNLKTSLLKASNDIMSVLRSLHSVGYSMQLYCASCGPCQPFHQQCPKHHYADEETGNDEFVSI